MSSDREFVRAEHPQTTHLDIIKEAYDRWGITYVVRQSYKEGHQYLFLYDSQEDRAELEHEDIDHLCRQYNSIKFDDKGAVASH